MTEQAIIRFTTRKPVIESVLRVMDTQGRIVKEMKCNPSNTQELTFRFNREGISAGIYFYSLESEGRTLATGRFTAE